MHEETLSHRFCVSRCKMKIWIHYFGIETRNEPIFIHYCRFSLDLCSALPQMNGKWWFWIIFNRLDVFKNHDREFNWQKNVSKIVNSEDVFSTSQLSMGLSISKTVKSIEFLYGLNFIQSSHSKIHLRPLNTFFETHHEDLGRMPISLCTNWCPSIMFSIAA